MKRFFFQHSIKLLALVIIITIGVFGITHGASAVGEGYIADAVYEWASRITASVLYFILTGVAWGVGMMAKALNFAMYFSLDTNLFVVVNLWTIVRDFTNMFFVLILIIMAFSLIFDVSALGVPGFGGIDTKKLIAKFIIAALLINFSLTIGGLIIDGVNEVNKVFLASIGDFSNRIGQALNPSATLLGITPEQLFSLSSQGGQVKDVSLTHIVKMASSIILGMIILFSLIVATFFAFVRIPILWMLLIFSPIAWIAGILPSTEKINKQWWSAFIGWNMFLPVFLFFLYVGLYFMSYQNQVLGGLAQGYDPRSVQQSLLTGAGVTFQEIFYYFLVAFTLIAGTKFALDAASGGGKLLTDVVSRGKDFAWGLPAFSQYRSAERTVKKEIEEIQKEGIGRLKIGSKPLGERGFFKAMDKYGLNPYGGKKGQERQDEKMGTLFGFKGFEADKLLLKKVAEKKKDHNEKDTPIEKLLKSLNEKDDVERLGAAEALLAKKKLSLDQVRKLYDDYNKDGKVPPAVKGILERFESSFTEKVEKEGISRTDFDKAFPLIPDYAKDKFLSAVQGKNFLLGVEKRVAETRAEQALIDQGKKSEEARIFKLFKDPATGNPITISEESYITHGIAGMSNRDVQQILSDTTSSGDARIQRELGINLTPKRVEDIAKNISAFQRNNLDTVIRNIENFYQDAAYQQRINERREQRQNPRETADRFNRATGGRDDNRNRG